MSKVVMESSTVKALARQLSDVTRYFQSVSSDVIGSADNSKLWSTTKTRDMSFNPEDFYYLRFGAKYVKIWKMRSKYYTLECFGFEPKDYPFFDQDKILDNDFYRNLYGKYSDFYDCLNHFADVCAQLTAFDSRPLF